MDKHVQENMHILKMVIYVMINVNIMFKMNKSIVILLVMRHIHINIIQKEKDNNVYQIVRLQDYNIHKILIVLVVVLVNMLIQ